MTTVRIEKRTFAPPPPELATQWLVVAGTAAMHIQRCIDHGFNECPMLKAAVDVYADAKKVQP